MGTALAGVAPDATVLAARSDLTASDVAEIYTTQWSAIKATFLLYSAVSCSMMAL